MKKINISITGALGKMGRILIKKISKNKKFNLISAIDINYKSIIISVFLKASKQLF